MQCKASVLNYCVQTGENVNISVYDIFQSTNGTPVFTGVGYGNAASNVGSTVSIQGDSGYVSTSSFSFNIVTPIGSSGISYALTFCGTDDDGVVLCCSVQVLLQSNCTSTDTSASGECTGVGPYYIGVNDILTIPFTDVHTSGAQPSYDGQTDGTVTNLQGNGPTDLELKGLSVGTNIMTFTFNGDQCFVEVRVEDEDSDAVGLCVTGYTPPIIPLGSSITIQNTEIHSSGVQPIEDSKSNTNISFDFLYPIVVSGDAEGTTTVVFDFNGDLCTVEFEVVDYGSGTTDTGTGTTAVCPYSCSTISSAMDYGQVYSNGIYEVGCGETHTLEIYVPNDSGEDFAGYDVYMSPTPTADGNYDSMNITYDSLNDRAIVSVTFTTTTTGCGITSAVVFSPDVSTALDELNCVNCTVATISVSDCPDCTVDPDTGITCTSKASMSTKTTETIAPSGSVLLGPATGCDCPGCEIKWINSPDNPMQVPIADPYQSSMILTIPVYAPDGTYEFFPSCCNCDA